MNNQKDLRRSALIALALVLLALGLMIWDDSGTKSKASLREPDPNVFSHDTVERINKHLQWTEKQTDLNALATDVENVEFAMEPRLGRPLPGYRGPLNPFDTEDAAGQVFKDLEPDAGRFENPRLPADRINSLVEQRQWLEKYDRRQTEEFVRAVKENARRAGYQVEINSQLKVVNVRRIPNSLEDARPSGAR